ncbi:reverse transcriptase [Plakobranchus ocellatus]|uniref:Reverse transcriptase n=1 Tax=Plakobranchus ocellatus TaxID=259542 RepID=A0AAV4A6X9_9GAST|nr:reverse transcriptase [Plakobranchus ocellatus]
MIAYVCFDKALDSDEEFRQLLNAKNQKIQFPPANTIERWRNWIPRLSLEHKLVAFGDIVYQTCLATFRAKIRVPQSRGQREMEMLHKQIRNLKRQMKIAPVEEQTGLQAQWRELKARHSALSRAESAGKRRNQKKKTRENFFKDPFQFARQLFQQKRPGT